MKHQAVTQASTPWLITLITNSRRCWRCPIWSTEKAGSPNPRCRRSESDSSKTATLRWMMLLGPLDTGCLLLQANCLTEELWHTWALS